MIVGILQSITYLISVFFFLYWFRRAYGDLKRIGVKTSHNETWAIWSFMIPVISLFRPVQIMKEIWSKTQKSIKNIDKNYDANYNTTPITFWWILFIGSNLVGRYILRNSFNEDTVESLIQLTQAHLISDTIQIIEALLVLFIVSKMETRLLSLYKNKLNTDLKTIE